MDTMANSGKRPKLHPKKCEICGTTFNVLQPMKRNRTCSRDCKTALVNRMVGDKQRGIPSSHPKGYGSHTADGYHRVYFRGKQRMAHDVIWECLNGRPVPAGHHVHHIDHNRQNNSPENLQLLDFMTHKRLHKECELIDGLWHKPCARCEKMLPITKEHFYLNERGWVQKKHCKPCYRIISRRSMVIGADQVLQAA
jgi:hypothetical protein